MQWSLDVSTQCEQLTLAEPVCHSLIVPNVLAMTQSRFVRFSLVFLSLYLSVKRHSYNRDRRGTHDQNYEDQRDPSAATLLLSPMLSLLRLPQACVAVLMIDQGIAVIERQGRNRPQLNSAFGIRTTVVGSIDGRIVDGLYILTFEGHDQYFAFKTGFNFNDHRKGSGVSLTVRKRI